MPGLKDLLAKTKRKPPATSVDGPPTDPDQSETPAAKQPEQFSAAPPSTSKPRIVKPAKLEQSPLEKTLEMLRTIEVGYILELLTPRLLIERDQQLKKAESHLETVNQRIEKLTAQREDVLRTRLDTLNQNF